MMNSEHCNGAQNKNPTGKWILIFISWFLELTLGLMPGDLGDGSPMICNEFELYTLPFKFSCIV